MLHLGHVARTLIALILIAGCDHSGQTGSAGMAPSCVCSSVGGRALVVGTVVTANSTRVTVQVEEIVGSGGVPIGLRIGDVIGGVNTKPANCGSSPPQARVVGERVFAAYSYSGAAVCLNGDFCDGGAGCLEGGASPCDAGCAPQTSCPGGRAAALASGDIVISTLGSELEFGDGVRVPFDQVGTLTDFGACSLRFPP
jgi:hypothetical protein